MTQQIKNIVIVGGGTAGWMSAALLSRIVAQGYSITLVESDAIGTIGVGEATIPPIQLFNSLLGLNEADFLRQTKGTIKLGIQFENWGKPGDCYMHAFGNIGRDLGFTHFHHYWLRAKSLGFGGDFWDYSFNYLAARQNRFAKMDRIPDSPLQGLVYAYHFDAGLYAKYLRALSEAAGVKRIEGRVVSVEQNSQSGFVESVILESGSRVSGELFIDCSGGRGLLIEQTLNVGFEDYDSWLLCDRAIAIPCEAVKPVTPYTRSIAHSFGWRWRIPLQHRTGNGMVYSSAHATDDQALNVLLNSLDGKPLADPNVIRFKIGRRKKQWSKNVVAIGLSSGFLEPLESTSIHLIQQGITRLIKLLPAQAITNAEIDEYNRQAQYEFEKIRDFIILHYHLNARQDSDFWRYCQQMDIPDSLRHKIELFRATGKLFREQDELFSEVAWHQVMLGQNIYPKSYHPLADSISEAQLREFLENLKIIMNRAVKSLPDHEAFLRR